MDLSVLSASITFVFRHLAILNLSPKSDQSQFSPKKISMINIEKMFWEVMRWSPDGKSIDQQTINSLNQIL